MAKYTVFIPKEFFAREVANTQIFLLIGLVLVILIFFGYKLFKTTRLRKKAESF